jgi:hypothetical protein
MPRELEKRGHLISAFESVDIISELVEKLPNGEFRNELDLDIILFGRSYRGKKVGPYARLLEFAPGEVIVKERTWESNIFYILVNGRLEASIHENGTRKVLGEVKEGNSFGEMAILAGTPRTATISVPGPEPAYVLELMRPALRLLRKLPKFAKAIDRSYRRGLELDLAWQPSSTLRFKTNANVSRNRISEWTQFYDVYDDTFTWTGSQPRTFRNVEPLLPPGPCGRHIPPSSGDLRSAAPQQM